MTDSTPAANSYAAFIPEVWSKKLNNLLEKECVMLQCVNRNYEGEIKNQGDKVKIITPASVTVNTLGTENISYSELTPTSQDLVIDQKKFFAFKINDVAQVQANADIMEAHLKNAKKAIEEVVLKYGRLDCAFNNAGIGPDGVRMPYESLTEISEKTENKYS